MAAAAADTVRVHWGAGRGPMRRGVAPVFLVTSAREGQEHILVIGQGEGTGKHTQLDEGPETP